MPASLGVIPAAAISQAGLFSSCDTHIHAYTQQAVAFLPSAQTFAHTHTPSPLPPFLRWLLVFLIVHLTPKPLLFHPIYSTDDEFFLPGMLDTMNDNNKNKGNGDQPPGDGGGGGAMPESPLAQVVSDVLASPAPVTFTGERVTPTRVSFRTVKTRGW